MVNKMECANCGSKTATWYSGKNCSNCRHIPVNHWKCKCGSIQSIGTNKCQVCGLWRDTNKK